MGKSGRVARWQREREGEREMNLESEDDKGLRIFAELSDDLLTFAPNFRKLLRFERMGEVEVSRVRLLPPQNLSRAMSFFASILSTLSVPPTLPSFSPPSPSLFLSPNSLLS